MINARILLPFILLTLALGPPLWAQDMPDKKEPEKKEPEKVENAKAKRFGKLNTEQRLRLLEKENRAFRKRIESLENKEKEEEPINLEDELEGLDDELEDLDDDSLGLGLSSRYGPVSVSFQLFADAGFGYRNPTEEGHSSFGDGSVDFFATAHVGDKFHALLEIITEFETDTNEVVLDAERIWGQWRFSQNFYIKFGREHSFISLWNRRYHHGRYFWLTTNQPMIAAFEDDEGLLPIHHTGIEIGGEVRLGSMLLNYYAAFSNGRGLTPEEVTNIVDRNDAKAFAAGFTLTPAYWLTFGASAQFDEIPEEEGNAARRLQMREIIQTTFLAIDADRLKFLAELGYIGHKDRVLGEHIHNWSGYAQVGYEIGNFTPYARYDFREMDSGDAFYSGSGSNRDRLEALIGVRYDPIENVVFKLQTSYGREQRQRRSTDFDRVDFWTVSAQLAWVF